MKKRTIGKLVYLILILVIIALMIVTACAKQATTPKPATTTPQTTSVTPKTTTAPAVTPQYGGALKILAPPTFLNIGYPPRPVPGFNPFQVAETVETVLQCDENGKPVPWLATGWKITDDKKSLILNLRPGIKYHDGTDFNAAAVKWCVETLAKEQQAELSTMASTEIIDDYTLKVNFKTWDNLMVDYFMTKPGNMISPTAVQKNGADWAVVNPVGTGPFKFTGYQQDVYVRALEKNGNYWQKGKPYLDSIEFLLVKDPMTRKASFLAGQGQLIVGLSPVDADELKKTGKYKVMTSPFTVFALQGDSANPDSPFYNVKVRQAVSYAIDNQAICNAFGYGFWKPTNQIGYPENPMFNPDIKGYPFNPTKAKELLKEAGYPNGFKMTIYYTSGGFDNVYLTVQRYLADVGIEAKLEVVEAARGQELSSKGWKDGIMTNVPYMAIGYPPTKMISFYFSPRSPFGKSVLRPEEVETVYQEAISAPSPEEMIKKTKEINRLLIDKYCVNTPIFVQPNIGAKVLTLHDERIYDPWTEMWRPADAWLEKK